jgi:hypothetical protein
MMNKKKYSTRKIFKSFFSFLLIYENVLLLFILIIHSRPVEATNTNNHQQLLQASTYRLISSSYSFAQYAPWYPCLNGTLLLEFKTIEPNGLLLYAQNLPYKYIQMSLIDGNLRLRMRIGEKDNPRGIILFYQTKKLNDDRWHEVQMMRHNEKTILIVDGESLHHVHRDANLESQDLYFGDSYDMMISNSGAGSSNGISNLNSYSNVFLIGGLPVTIQTYDLSLGTALFEPRFNGFIRNVRALNCSSPFLTRLNVIASNGLRYMNGGDSALPDSCLSNPCHNQGVCSLIDDPPGSFECDCSYTSYEGRFCERRKFNFLMIYYLLKMASLEVLF